MKKLLLSLLVLPLLTSCDNVDEADRYIDVGPVEVARKVLLEEFTGQECINCPEGHQILEQLEEQYGDNLIVVSIHGGPFGVKPPFGLSTEDGDIYAEYWKVVAYPSAVVDRNSGTLSMDQWAGAVREDISLTTELQMSLEAQLSENGKEIEVFTTMVSPISMEGRLQLWVIENDIIAYQVSKNNEFIPNYEHNNVFRECINGVWGEEIPLKANIVNYVQNNVEINQAWNIDNVRIVGFYYNQKGVVQVERCAISELSPGDDKEK